MVLPSLRSELHSYKTSFNIATKLRERTAQRVVVVVHCPVTWVFSVLFGPFRGDTRFALPLWPSSGKTSTETWRRSWSDWGSPRRTSWEGRSGLPGSTSSCRSYWYRSTPSWAVNRGRSSFRSWVHLAAHSYLPKSSQLNCKYIKNTIDYRCADSRFLISPCGVAVSYQLSFQQRTMVNAGIWGWKLHLSESTWCQE